MFSTFLFSHVFVPDHTHSSGAAKKTSMVDKLSPMKLMPWNKTREDTLEEINRKMQRALEEALMKNIHLQEVGVV